MYIPDKVINTTHLKQLNLRLQSTRQTVMCYFGVWKGKMKHICYMIVNCSYHYDVTTIFLKFIAILWFSTNEGIVSNFMN